MKKKISITVPCYNEEGNVRLMAETLVKIMDSLDYRYEIVFTDNCSTDNTKNILRELAAENINIKVLMNNRNYGVDGRSSRNTYRYLSGDAMIYIPCDFQEPPELIPEFVKYWEQGYKVVCGQKIGSQEGRIKYFLRKIFYKIIGLFSDTPQYEHISGIALLDREALNELMKSDEDFLLRHVLADMGYEIKLIEYIQQKRKSGKSTFNTRRYLTVAINSLVNTSTVPLRMMTVVGLLMSLFSFLLSAVFLVLKLVLWHKFQTGIAPVLIGMLFLGSVQLFSLGVIGEYIGVVLRKVTKKPDVILSEKLNFDKEE